MVHKKGIIMSLFSRRIDRILVRIFRHVLGYLPIRFATDILFGSNSYHSRAAIDFQNSGIKNVHQLAWTPNYVVEKRHGREAVIVKKAVLQAYAF